MRILFFLLLPILAFGQLSIHASSGLNFPIGDFSDDDINSDASQLAKTGYYVELQPSYQITKNIGALLIAGYAINATDEESVTDQLAEKFGIGWFFTSDDFKQLHLLVGVSLGLDNDQMSFSIAPLVGLTKVDYIVQHFSPVLSTNTLINTINDNKGLTLGVQLNFLMPITNKLSIGIKGRFLSNTIDRDAITVTSDDSGITRTDWLEDTTLNSIQTGIVISYNL